MAELSLRCLPVGMTSVGKNVYPVSDSSLEPDADDVAAGHFEGKGRGGA